MNSSRKRPGLLFTLVAPAGAGKNRLMNHVLNLTPLHQIATATTRPMRPGEQEGREHYFVSREEFERMIESDELLEHQVIHGNLYGILRASVEAALDSGNSVIADIEPLGAAAARAAYPENVVSIFIQAPSIGTLIQRMRDRGEAEAEIGKRLLRVPQELVYARECHYVILNDDFKHAADLLYHIVLAELNGTQDTVQGDPVIDYRYTYEVKAVPVYGDQALRRSATPEVPTMPLPDGELPHQAALRTLRAELGLKVDENALITTGKRQGSYLPPVCLEYTHDAGGECVTYVYLYRLDEAFDPPAGWRWEPIATLPEALRSAALEVVR